MVSKQTTLRVISKHASAKYKTKYTPFVRATCSLADTGIKGRIKLKEGRTCKKLTRDQETRKYDGED